jgi:cystathionine gamma-synthase
MDDGSATQPRREPEKLADASIVVSAGRPERLPDAPVNPAVTLTSTYVATPGAPAAGDRVYARWDNPSWNSFEQALGVLEGGDARLFASGLAAVAAVLAQVPHGATVVVPRHAYSGTLGLARSLEAAGGLVVLPVDIADTVEVLRALDGAHLLWVETPTNPMLEVAELGALVKGAREHGVLVAADNTFATPLGLRPLDHGADVVVHSVTKYLSGHSDVVLGATVTAPTPRGESLREALHAHRTLHGAIPGPFEAWLALRGLRTLDVRLTRAVANAAELADRLCGHPAVGRVRYPGLPGDPGHERARSYLRHFGAIVSIEVDGAEAAERVCSAVRLWMPATSLGGVESSLERRRRQTTESPTVPEGLIRLSVGIEDVEDLWDDLCSALDQCVS